MHQIQIQSNPNPILCLDLTGFAWICLDLDLGLTGFDLDLDLGLTGFDLDLDLGLTGFDWIWIWV